MKFVDKIYTKTHEVRQSKFIAFLVPFSQFTSTLEELKNSHPKARHFVVSYRYLNEFNQIVEYSSDDGEPKGTSGKPSLFVLQGLEMINSGVIIVRYFGGTKLGTGGLVRAYSDSVNLVLNSASLVEYKQETNITIYFEYSNIRMVEYECLTCGVDIVEKSFDVGSIYKIKGIESNMKLFLEKMDRLVEVVK
ncbi:MAG: YigZ family protein [Campylobacterales bacterium]|nr:YigZ family protein [Campylobacterales bacterium]